MATRRATNRGRGFARKTPNFSWTTLINTTLVAVGPTGKVVIGSFSLTEPEDRTLVRVRGSSFATSDQVAASEFQLGCWGMILVTEDAFAIGATAIPGLSSDGGNDWVVWQALQGANTQATSVGFETNSGRRAVIDSKAQRIWQEGQRLVIMAENVHATHGFNFGVSMRILTRLRT